MVLTAGLEQIALQNKTVVNTLVSVSPSTYGLNFKKRVQLPMIIQY